MSIYMLTQRDSICNQRSGRRKEKRQSWFNEKLAIDLAVAGKVDVSKIDLVQSFIIIVINIKYYV